MQQWFPLKALFFFPNKRGKKNKNIHAVADPSSVYSWVRSETSGLSPSSVGRMTTKVKINKHLIYMDCYLWISKCSRASATFACKTHNSGDLIKSDANRHRDFVAHTNHVIEMMWQANV